MTRAVKQDAVALQHELQQADPADMMAGAAEVDDTLRLLFTCCHPSISSDAQAVLALKVLGGFNLAEIARAFLSREAAIEKQLTRTKARLREVGATFSLPPETELATRLEGALATLYLLFTEGYKATLGDQLIREELCDEALRLANLLVQHPVGNRPVTHALLALMLLHRARFPARTNPTGGLLRLADQDRTVWDQTCIDRGLQHLAAASEGDRLTSYHLQAGIAANHCLAADVGSTDWTRIVAQYDALMNLAPSPVVALNRAVAIANLHGPQAGLDALNAIEDAHRLASQHLVYAVSGDLHSRLGDHAAAATAYRRALQLVRVGPEQDHLVRMLEKNEHPAG